MKFSCSTTDLQKALQLVSRAIGANQALPILGNILFEAKGSTCTVSATDLEVSIVTQLEAKIENEGSITIPSKAILNFAQYNPDAEVIVELKEGAKVSLSSRSAKTIIAGEAASEYPTIAPIERQMSFSLKVDSLLRALHFVTFASARTSLRPVLSGVSVKTVNGKMIFAATDSYRLSEYGIPVEMEGDVTCIIPTKILEEVRSVLSSMKDRPVKKDEAIDAAPPSVQVTLGRQQIEFATDSTRLLSRLIEGKFPDYQQIIPKEMKTKVAFTVKDLLTAAKRLHYFAREVNNKLTFHCNREETRISTPQTQAGRDESTLVAELQGDENTIALSSAYLLDFLGHIDADNVLMQMSDNMHPAVFSLANDPEFLHLIMPLRMTEE